MGNYSPVVYSYWKCTLHQEETGSFKYVVSESTDLCVLGQGDNFCMMGKREGQEIEAWILLFSLSLFSLS